LVGSGESCKGLTSQIRVDGSKLYVEKSYQFRKPTSVGRLDEANPRFQLGKFVKPARISGLMATLRSDRPAPATKHTAHGPV